MTTYCAPCITDLALMREAATAVSGTACCAAHAVLLSHPQDAPGRRRARLAQLRSLAESKAANASVEEQPGLELLVHEYTLAGAMDMPGQPRPDGSAPQRQERAPGAPGEPGSRAGKRRGRGRGERHDRPAGERPPAPAGAVGDTQLAAGSTDAAPSEPASGAPAAGTPSSPNSSSSSGRPSPSSRPPRTRRPLRARRPPRATPDPRRATPRRPPGATRRPRRRCRRARPARPRSSLPGSSRGGLIRPVGGIGPPGMRFTAVPTRYMAPGPKTVATSDAPP